MADDACGDVGCLAEFAAELMADMTEFEAQFTEPEKIRVVAGRLCKDCGIQPSYDSACESCWSVDGDCCYCRNCGGSGWTSSQLARSKCRPRRWRLVRCRRSTA